MELQLTKSRGYELDMKMLFLDTVVMPVLSQMMRGKEIPARACLCWALNTPGFSHQNLHGSIMDTMSEDALGESILGWEDIAWLELPPECERTMGDSALQHRRAPGPRQCLLSTEDRSMTSWICLLLPSSGLWAPVSCMQPQE